MESDFSEPFMKRPRFSDAEPAGPGRRLPPSGPPPLGGLAGPPPPRSVSLQQPPPSLPPHRVTDNSESDQPRL